uniref:MFS transporter n=1 Tax=Fervidobacterium thailandense TaxID=1008305 RepID=A0A7C4W8N0_9BACT
MSRESCNLDELGDKKWKANPSLLITYYTLVDGLAMGVYGTLFNLLLKSVGFSTSAVGRVTSNTLWGSALLSLFLGFLSDKVDKKTVLVFSHLLGVFFGTYRALSISTAALNVSSFFFGGFSAVSATVVSTILVMKTDRDERSKYFGLNFGIGMLTGTVGNFIGGFLGELLGLKLSVLLSNLVRIFALIPILKLSVKEQEVSRGVWNHVKQVRKNIPTNVRNVLIYYFLSTVSVGFGAGLFVSFGNIIFHDLFNFKPSLIGIILSLAQLATGLGAIFSHKLGKKFSEVRVLIFSYVLVPIMIVFLSFTREPAVFSTVYVLRFAVMNMVSPLLSSVVFSQVPTSILASVNGLNNFLNNVSRALSAELFAFFSQYSAGYTLIFLVSSVFYFANAFAMLRLLRNIRV